MSKNSQENKERAWMAQRNMTTNLMQNYIMLGWLAGGVGSLLKSKAGFFRSMQMGGLMAFYLYLANEKVLNTFGAKIPSHSLLGYSFLMGDRWTKVAESKENNNKNFLRKTVDNAEEKLKEGKNKAMEKGKETKH